MKKMKVLMTCVFAVAVFGFVSTSQAEETKDIQGIYEECGLGALLFPSWPIGASVSNFTWDLGTTAATSGLTTPEACKGGEAKMAAFIHKSYEAIEMDLASGEGKYLDSLVELGSTDAAVKDALIAAIRKDFADVVAADDFSEQTRMQKVQALFTIVYQNVNSLS